jgi:hypothetical protein
MKEYLVFVCRGGIGKNIAATAVVKALKSKYKESKIIIVTGWIDVWINNPNVYRCFNFNQTNYFYEDFVKDKDVSIFAVDPYSAEDFLFKNKHLIEIWCDLIGVEHREEMPEVFITYKENQFYSQKFLRKKPIFLVQTNGGINNQFPMNWARDLDISTATDVIENFVESHHIIHVKLEDQPIIDPNIEVFLGSIRELIVLTSLADKLFLIDSAVQHIAQAVSKKATVCWTGTSDKVFGYPIHTNIYPIKEKDMEINPLAFLEEIDISSDPRAYPYDTNRIFSVTEIVESLNGI